MLTALAVQPAQEHGDGPRVMAQVVAGPGDHPQVGGSVARGQYPGVQRRHYLVVAAVDQQEVTGAQLGHRSFRRNLSQGRGPSSKVGGRLLGGDHPGPTGMEEETNGKRDGNEVRMTDDGWNEDGEGTRTMEGGKGSEG